MAGQSLMDLLEDESQWDALADQAADIAPPPDLGGVSTLPDAAVGAGAGAGAGGAGAGASTVPPTGASARDLQQLLPQPQNPRIIPAPPLRYAPNVGAGSRISPVGAIGPQPRERDDRLLALATYLARAGG